MKTTKEQVPRFRLIFLFLAYFWTHSWFGLYIVREGLFAAVGWQTIYVIDAFLMVCISFILFTLIIIKTYLAFSRYERTFKRKILAIFLAILCSVLPLWPAYNFLTDAVYGNAQTITGFFRVVEETRSSRRSFTTYRVIINDEVIGSKYFLISVFRSSELKNYLMIKRFLLRTQSALER